MAGRQQTNRLWSYTHVKGIMCCSVSVANVLEWSSCTCDLKKTSMESVLPKLDLLLQLSSHSSMCDVSVSYLFFFVRMEVLYICEGCSLHVQSLETRKLLCRANVLARCVLDSLSSVFLSWFSKEWIHWYLVTVLNILWVSFGFGGCLKDLVPVRMTVTGLLLFCLMK